jgi:hypothetical protein
MFLSDAFSAQPRYLIAAGLPPNPRRSVTVRACEVMHLTLRPHWQCVGHRFQGRWPAHQPRRIVTSLEKLCPVHRDNIAMSGSSGQTVVTAMFELRHTVSKSVGWPLTESILLILDERPAIRRLHHTRRLPMAHRIENAVQRVSLATNRLRKRDCLMGKSAKSIPQRLKPTLIFLHLRHD